MALQHPEGRLFRRPGCAARWPGRVPPVRGFRKAGLERDPLRPRGRQCWSRRRRRCREPQWGHCPRVERRGILAERSHRAKTSSASTDRAASAAIVRSWKYQRLCGRRRVEGTARDASNLGYRTIVVSDACAAASEAAHHASIETLGLLGQVSTVDEVHHAVRASIAPGV